MSSAGKVKKVKIARLKEKSGSERQTPCVVSQCAERWFKYISTYGMKVEEEVSEGRKGPAEDTGWRVSVNINVTMKPVILHADQNNNKQITL